MSPIVATTEVERSAAEVFAYATDPARFGEWQKGVVDGHVEGSDDGGPPGPGARCVTTRRIGGSNRQVTSEFSHVDPPRTWGVRGVDGPIRAAVDVVVEPVTDSRARLTISVDFLVTASASCWCRCSCGPKRAARCRTTWPRSSSGWKRAEATRVRRRRTSPGVQDSITRSVASGLSRVMTTSEMSATNGVAVGVFAGGGRRGRRSWPHLATWPLRRSPGDRPARAGRTSDLAADQRPCARPASSRT